MPAPEVAEPAQEGSKFKRFLKRLGRRPSEENRRADGHGGDDKGLTSEQQQMQSGTTSASPDVDSTAKKTGSMRSRKGSKSGNRPSSTKGKRSDSFGGRFFQAAPNAPPMPAQQKKTSAGVVGTALPLQGEGAFGGSSGEGLADTLTIPPPNGSPAPQLDGLPAHEPIATGELMPTAPRASNTGKGVTESRGSGPETLDGNVDGSSMTAAGDRGAATNGVLPDGDVQSSYGSSRRNASSDIDSTDGGLRGRDSLDNRTMDTGKSRASTKPTTLMSLDAPEHGQGSYMPLAQIAQHRHGETMSNGTPVASMRSATSDGQGNVVTSSSAIQFAPQPPLGRTVSGTIVQLPGSNDGVETSPYVNVPTLSRPHPSNNPTPTGYPADNASMLTLASSTAAASIGGGGASLRGHSQAAPSFGGARSIGGSLMGERRNSSDTYASIKALPPLSRRGSDSSSRTGKSVAASATGRSSAQAMMSSATGGILAGPGAPSDRISLHRTPSQRTIATQLSIPISTSNQGVSSGADGSGPGQTGSYKATDATLPSITTTAPAQDQLERGDIGSSAAVKAHADDIAAV